MRGVNTTKREGHKATSRSIKTMSIKNNSIPRRPAESELAELFSYESVLKEHSIEYDPDELRRAIANAHIAVFDKYTASHPPYSGKVMLVIYPSDLRCHALYAWDSETGIYRVSQLEWISW